MVLELATPASEDWSAFAALTPRLLSYALSFVFLGIYWNNHHLLQAVDRVDGRVLWANLHLPFWLSLISFGTGWGGERPLVPLPLAVYGTILLRAGFRTSSSFGCASRFTARTPRWPPRWGGTGKGSLVVYAIAVPPCFVQARLSITI
jgi:uncharacterized membrane protein